jgi:hypothetical protein
MDPSKPSSGVVPNLRVRCESWREFVEYYAGDIGKGGLFVATAETPAVLSTLDVTLQLPEATEIVLRARVVQVLSSELAELQAKPPGLGLELLEIDSERKRQISQLVEFARWQGATNDPNASFARTLLELSPSLAPAEVGYRLSLLPGGGARHHAEAIPAPRRPSESGMPRAPEPARRNEGSRPSMRAPAADSAAQTQVRASLQPPAAGARGSIPPRASDPIKLKLVLTEFAHKHYEAALRTAREMLETNPGDPQALRWQYMCNARLALARKDDDTAADNYEQALQYDQDNREAREFVKNHRRDKKLHSLPFGRYFTTKKK